MYKIYLFEIDKGSRKVYIQYSTKGVEECFEKFKKKLKKGNTPFMLKDLCNASPIYKTARGARRGSENLCDNLEALGYDVVAGAVLQNSYWQIYVIELNNNPFEVYVGQTKYDPEIRLIQHRIGYNSTNSVRKAEKAKLRPDLYGDSQRLKSQGEARKVEKDTAEKLKKKNYKVHGGH
jgi:hypothetical protein